jgi:uncharacterized protein (TIGR02001 family)
MTIRIVGIATAVTVLALAAAAPAAAGAAEFVGKISFTSQYTLRGIAQTKEDPAVQGNIDLVAGNFYLGIWGSNVDFSLVGLDPAAQAEFDLYAGYLWKAKNGFGIDVGIIHYDYPGATDLNYEEYYFGVIYKIAKLKYWYADDYLGFGNTEGYLDGAVDIPLGGVVTLGLHAGYSTFEDEIFFQDYFDYKVALSRTFKKLGVEVAYIDSDDELLGDQSEGRGVVTISYSP